MNLFQPIPVEQLRVFTDWRSAPMGTLVRVSDGSASETVFLKSEFVENNDTHLWLLGLFGDTAGLLFSPGQVYDEATDASEFQLAVLPMPPVNLTSMGEEKPPGLVVAADNGALLVRARISGNRIGQSTAYVSIRGDDAGRIQFKYPGGDTVAVGMVTVMRRQTSIQGENLYSVT